MVPFEAFSIEAPHSSSAFCSGCDGGTQCDELELEGLVLRERGGAVASRIASPAAGARLRARPQFVRDDDIVLIPPRIGVGFNANFEAIQP